MADFVAVIRRAVDGLSDNTPEMRVKVYEKARAAVRRQLESMKPRPADAMFDRQMGKLENAINEVEAEHAEALPPIDGEEAAVPAAAAAAATHAVAHEQTVQEPEEQPHHVAAEPEDRAAAEPPVDAETPVEEPAVVEQPASVDVPAAYDEPVRDEAPLRDEEPLHASEPEHRPEFLEPESDHRDADAQQAFEPVAEHEPQAAADYDDLWHGPDADPEPEVQPEPVHAADPIDHDPFGEPPAVEEHRPFAHYPGNEGVETDAAVSSEPFETRAQPAAWDLSEWNGRPQDTDRPASEDDALLPQHDDAAARDPSPAQNGSEGWSWNNDDPFDKRPDDTSGVSAPVSEASSWAWPVEKQAEPAAQPEQKTASWSELDDLIGYGGAAAQSAGARSDALPDLPEKQYAPEKRRSRLNILPILIALVIVGLLAGGGYAYWQNQDKVNGVVGDIMTAILPADTTTTTPTPAESDADNTTPATDNSAVPADNNSAVQPTTTAQTEVAAVEPTSKFTQRLQADGTEVDSGPATQTAGDGTAEGTTVAAQTDAGSRQADNAAAAAAAVEGGDPTVETSGQTEQAEQTATAQAPVGVSQKMFLYEEKLGQTAPIAVEGTVVWSVKEESPGGDAKPEPAIQGQINVPDRGLTALVTIKRNADTSLPASHIIEFVFSLPESFEGGGIDSVQRVAMKRTEQDRGDALIAVPAKITDDFHMIALNDFPEAVTRNIELLRSRDWIDIPITYRNGRRALITMEKGPTGVEAFNTVMRNWSTLAKPVATSQ